MRSDSRCVRAIRLRRRASRHRNARRRGGDGDRSGADDGHSGFAEDNGCEPAAGECAAGGWYVGGPPDHLEEAFVASERNGRWGKALEVPGIATLNSGGNAVVTSIACGAVGDCAARPDTGALPPDATTHTSGPDAAPQGLQSQAG